MKQVKGLRNWAYEAPRAEAVEVVPQGILCASEIVGNSTEPVGVVEFEFP